MIVQRDSSNQSGGSKSRCELRNKNEETLSFRGYSINQGGFKQRSVARSGARNRQSHIEIIKERQNMLMRI